MKHQIVWFEIPVKDLQRSMKFYSKVLGIELKPAEHGPIQMAMFPGDQESVSGALVAGGDNSPSDKGPLIYLNGGDDLAAPLSRVEPAGGKILMPKTNIGQYGFIATFKDTEGNKVALHSMK